MYNKEENLSMSQVGELTTAGKFIRETLAGNPKLKNREVADLVINHFPDQEFSVLALRQRVANFKFLEKRKQAVTTAPVVPTVTQN